MKKMELIYLEEKKIYLDVSNMGNFHEALEQLKIEDDIYEIKLTGTKNFEMEELIQTTSEELSKSKTLMQKLDIVQLLVEQTLYL